MMRRAMIKRHSHEKLLVMCAIGDRVNKSNCLQNELDKMKKPQNITLIELFQTTPAPANYKLMRIILGACKAADLIIQSASLVIFRIYRPGSSKAAYSKV